MVRCRCGRFPEPNKSRCYWCVRLEALELSIETPITDARLKEAHHKVLFKYHPDKWTGAGKRQYDYAGERTQQANDAIRDLKGKAIPEVPLPDPKPKPVPPRTKEWVPQPPPSPQKPAPQPATEPVRRPDPPVSKNPDQWTEEEISGPGHGRPPRVGPSENGNPAQRPPSALANFIVGFQQWILKAKPWLIAVLLLFVIPPLLIRAYDSPSFAADLVTAVVKLLLLTTVVITAVRIWRSPSLRKAALILGLLVAGFLLWTRTPVARLLTPGRFFRSADVPRRPLPQPMNTPRSRHQARRPQKPSPAVTSSPVSPSQTEAAGKNDHVIRTIARPDGSTVPIVRPIPDQP